MAKNNIRSIRYSDDVKAIVESIKLPEGDSFNEKFETLCLEYKNTIPEREKALKELNKKIAEREKYLQTLNNKIRQMTDLEWGIDALKDKIANVNNQVQSMLKD